MISSVNWQRNHSPFFPTKEKFPAANHLSLASLTLCALMARLVSSNPSPTSVEPMSYEDNVAHLVLV